LRLCKAKNNGEDPLLSEGISGNAALFPLASLVLTHSVSTIEFLPPRKESNSLKLPSRSWCHKSTPLVKGGLMGPGELHWGSGGATTTQWKRWRTRSSHYGQMRRRKGMKTIGLRNHLRSNPHSEISELLLSLNIQSIKKLVPNFIIPFRYSQLVDGSLLKILRKHRQEAWPTTSSCVWYEFQWWIARADLIIPLAIVPQAACDATVLIDATISKVMNCNMRSL